MTFSFKTAAFCAAVALGASSAHAATVTIDAFTGDFSGALAGTTASTIETFETLGAGSGEGEIASNLTIAVGTIGVIAGGTGTGASVIGTGTDLALRDGDNFGRTNTTAGGEWFLDSNDTYGANLNVDGSVFGYRFNRVFFTLTDGTDVGATVRVTESTGGASDFYMSQVDANQKLVVINFDSTIYNVKIEIGNINGSGNFMVNDGYGIDDITAAFVGNANDLEPIPLPAGGLLLLTALGGLGAARRRKARKAA